VKVTRKNFGRDRRYPIVNRYRDQGLEAHRKDEALERAIGKPRAGSVDV
jgi:NAD+ synthase